MLPLRVFDPAMLHFVAPSLSSRAAAGALAVEDIKGSSTWADIASSFGIELGRLYREVGVDPSKVPPTTPVKDTGKLAGIQGFETDAVRLAVARILGIPYSGEKGGEPSTMAPVTSSPQAASTVEAPPEAGMKLQMPQIRSATKT